MTRRDVVTLGSAIVDLIVRVQAREVDRLGLARGTMTLASVEEVDRLLHQLGREPEIRGGGSAANTAAGLAALGVEVTMVTQIGDDELGERWVDELAEAGVEVVLMEPRTPGATGRSLILVDERGERTMVTALGVAHSLVTEDLPLALLGTAKVCFVEGYLLDAAPTGLFERLAAVRGLGTRVALTLGDQLLVDRHRERLQRALGHDVDVVLGNGAEAAQLIRRQALSAIVEELQTRGVEGALTLGSEGAVVFDRTQAIHEAPPLAVEVVDTTGAGDHFAAGYLAAFVVGASLRERALLGNLLGGLVVSQPGGRLVANLQSHVLTHAPTVASRLGIGHAGEPSEGASR